LHLQFRLLCAGFHRLTAHSRSIMAGLGKSIFAISYFIVVRFIAYLLEQLRSFPRYYYIRQFRHVIRLELATNHLPATIRVINFIGFSTGFADSIFRG
jgi:hypothetical protein